ncbi:hypothetical protein CN286_26615 [Bacillus anthracis]|nr:hypothetical protein CN286_26615 [Bacillus anthracis]
MSKPSNQERLKIIESTPHLIKCEVLKSDFSFLLKMAKKTESLETENKRLHEALQKACNSLGADIDDYLQE